jgi:mannan endo-1,4-beta-mannosidase
VHWYPEMKGRKRITEDDESRKTIDARVAAPRSLWDPTFREPSWIGDQWGKPVRLIPWLKELVDKRYPGTKLSITEYNFGSGDHVSGGIAQADVLGIFGREGVYLASYWGNGAGVGPLPKYIAAAFALYQNYDGHGGHFGDTEVAATNGNLVKASIYAATDSKVPGRLTVLVLNKDQRANYQARIELIGAACSSAKGYRFDSNSPDLHAVPPAAVSGGELTATVPALSATLFVCEKS